MVSVFGWPDPNVHAGMLRELRKAREKEPKASDFAQQCSTILLHPIQAQQYCSILLTSVNNVGRTTLFNPVKQQAHNFYACSTIL
jgi:hypothetical protein